VTSVWTTGTGSPTGTTRPSSSTYAPRTTTPRPCWPPVGAAGRAVRRDRCPHRRDRPLVPVARPVVVLPAHRRGANYAVHCRRPSRTTTRRSSRKRGRGRPARRERAQLGHDFFAVGVLSVSPDHRWLAYGTDTTGAERYTLHIIDLEGTRSCRDRARRLLRLSWANDNATVFYVRTDDAMRRSSCGGTASAPNLPPTPGARGDRRALHLSTGRTKDGSSSSSRSRAPSRARCGPSQPEPRRRARLPAPVGRHRVHADHHGATATRLVGATHQRGRGRLPLLAAADGDTCRPVA